VLVTVGQPVPAD